MAVENRIIDRKNKVKEIIEKIKEEWKWEKEHPSLRGADAFFGSCLTRRKMRLLPAG